MAQENDLEHQAAEGLILGAVMIAAGVALTQVHIAGGTISQLNGLCTSGVGQLAQMFSGSAQHDCGEIAFVDHTIGWLLGVGAAAIAAGIWLRRIRRRLLLPQLDVLSPQPDVATRLSRLTGA